MPTRKPLKVRQTGSRSLSLREHTLFPLADRYSARILIASVTDQPMSDDATGEALYALMRRSRFYKPTLEAGDVDQGGLMNACYEAGLVLGLAFGLRLRGAA